MDGPNMPQRIRHCVECPKCSIHYLIGFSPYNNGSYLEPSVVGSWEAYTLYCSCKRPYTISRWSGVRACQVSNAAYNRGYGPREEVAPVRNYTWNSWSLDIARYLNFRPPEKDR